MKEKAYAKINLFLDVVGKRLDNYHNLEMIMAPINVYDELCFKKTQEASIKIKSTRKITEKTEDNLVYKVAKYIIDKHSIDGGLEIEIKKDIPIAAGLAGGSADAAATLRGLNRLFKLKYSKKDLADIGEKFGSDIPHCVYNKLCIARGKGEEIVFLNKKINMPVLIVCPDIEVSTKAVFETVKMDQVEHKKITTMSNAIYNQNKALISQSLYNALEPFSFSLFEEIKTLKDEISTMGVDGVLMSGTGPTIFVLDKNKEKLQEIKDKYQGKYYVELTKIK